MKHVIVILLLCISALSSAQVSFPLNDAGEVEFIKVIQLDSSTKDNNFNKSKLWVANAFKSAQDVIQYENREEGKLVCKGLIAIKSTGMGMGGTIHWSQAGNVLFTLEMGVKDDRCRIRIYDLTHQAENAGGNLNNIKPSCGTLSMTLKTWNSVKIQALENVNDIISEYEAALNKESKGDDW